MRPIILLVMALSTAWGACTPATGYAFCRSVTVDHTKVPNTDQTDFPVLFSGTYTYLKVAGSGGDVQNSNGYDIVFTSDSSGSSPLYWDLENYVSTTGEIEAWVKIPSLSHTTDTAFFFSYGNASISTYQSTASSTWDSNFHAVWHLKEGTASNRADSTTNGNTAALGSNSVQVAAKIGYGVSHGAGNGGLNVANSASIQAPTNFSLHAWVYTPSVTGSYMCLVEKDATAATAPNRSYYLIIDPSNNMTVGADIGAGTPGAITGSATGTGAWHHFVGTYDGSNFVIYRDGASAGTAASSGSPNSGTRRMTIGSNSNDMCSVQNGVQYDEIRLSWSARSADWVATEYNSQNDPATFYTIGAASTGAQIKNQAILFF